MEISLETKFVISECLPILEKLHFFHDTLSLFPEDTFEERLIHLLIGRFKRHHSGLMDIYFVKDQVAGFIVDLGAQFQIFPDSSINLDGYNFPINPDTTSTIFGLVKSIDDFKAQYDDYSPLLLYKHIDRVRTIPGELTSLVLLFRSKRRMNMTRLFLATIQDLSDDFGYGVTFNEIFYHLAYKMDLKTASQKSYFGVFVEGEMTQRHKL